MTTASTRRKRLGIILVIVTVLAGSASMLTGSSDSGFYEFLATHPRATGIVRPAFWLVGMGRTFDLRLSEGEVLHEIRKLESEIERDPDKYQRNPELLSDLLQHSGRFRRLHAAETTAETQGIASGPGRSEGPPRDQPTDTSTTSRLLDRKRKRQDPDGK